MYGLNGEIELFSLTTGKSVWKKSDFQIPDLYYGMYMFPHYIVFHPCKDLILPGTLSQVLTLRGEFTPGPFLCDESCSEFTNCCFSSDSSKMVTYYDDKLMVWNIFSGKIERTLQCHELYSFSFTASGSFLGTTDVENAFKVYDCRNDYRVESAECSSDFPIEIVSAFDQNSWVCSVDYKLVIISDALVFKDQNCSIKDIFLPNSYFCSDNLKTFFQNRGQSWFSKFRKKFDTDPINSPRYISIGDKSVLIYCLFSTAMQVFNVKKLVDMEQLPEWAEFSFSKLSLDGSFAYSINRSKEILTVCSLESNLKSSRPYVSNKPFHLSVVRDGVVFLGDNDTPELWNIDVTKRLSRFDQLAGAKECISVSDELIACLCPSSIIFFNVFTEKIMSKTILNDDGWFLINCSTQYHVLACSTFSEVHALWKDGAQLDEWEDVLNEHDVILSAAFSPQVDKLAMQKERSNTFLVFDVSSISVIFKIDLPQICESLEFKFFDDKNLLCLSDNILYLVDVEDGKLLAFLDMGDRTTQEISVCRERSIVLAGYFYFDTLELIKVWLPR